MGTQNKRKSKRSDGGADDGDDHNGPTSGKVQKAFFKNAANWNLEQDYENHPRKRNKRDQKESTRLPIKTADGRLQHVHEASVDDGHESEASDGDWLEDTNMHESDAEEEKEDEVPELPVKDQIRNAQEELAKIATSLNMDPEDHPGAFRALAKIGESKIPAIQKLAMMTQMAVYKDVIPGYRIRPAEEGAKELLSKEVRTLRTYEQALVAGYQAYLKKLYQTVKTDAATPIKGKDKKASLGSIAMTCACTLLTSVPHFNFRSELIKIVTWKLSRRKVDDDYIKVLDALRKLFEDDEDGRYALEAVQLITKMMKSREYEVHESAIDIFLDLRLLSEFGGKASNERAELEQQNGPKPKKVFLTQRQRKNRKEQKALEKDMDAAEAVVSHEERERMQSETLKLVFATYFRILKARIPHLMGATLEGLSKYSHLINQDFFGDLLEALKDLIRYADADANATTDGFESDASESSNEEDSDAEDTPTRNTSREALLCNATAFALLAGQDAHNARNNLHLDLSFFSTHLYRSLLALSVNPDLEKTVRSHLWDPASQPRPARELPNRVNIQTTTVLLIRCLTAALLPHWGVRAVPPVQLAAFSKQLMLASLHMPEKSSRAVLALLTDVADTHKMKVAALWNTEERKGDGSFNPTSATIGGSNPFTSTVWEGEILRRHFSPQVREGVKMMEKSIASVTGGRR